MAQYKAKSEITGSVWKINVKNGDAVASGDVLMILESMKMEIPVIAEDDGVISEILVKEKDAVTDGQVVALIDQ
jgi:biotin carboxyl carrier protein